MTRPNEQLAMTVHCPHCSTGYLLPDHLVGPKGARVSCPECRGEFAVWREHPDSVPGGHPEPRSAATSEIGPASSTEAAETLLDGDASVAVLDEPEEAHGPAVETHGTRDEIIVAERDLEAPEPGPMTPAPDVSPVAPADEPATVMHEAGVESSPEPAAVAIAASVLDALEETVGGGALRDATRRGRVFAEHGPAILDAFAEFRRRGGEPATAACFRAALRDRCGIHLEARPPA